MTKNERDRRNAYEMRSMGIRRDRDDAIIEADRKRRDDEAQAARLQADAHNARVIEQMVANGMSRELAERLVASAQS